MRFIVSLILVFGLVLSAGAAQINISNTFTSLELGVDSTGTAIDAAWNWIMRIYITTDANIDFATGSPTGDDTWTTAELTWTSAGADGYYAMTLLNSDSPPYNIAAGSQIYTVLFNSSSYATATEYAVLDSSPWTVSYPAGVGTYDATGSLQTDWQAIPEPGTLALLGLGTGVIFVSRRRRTNKSA